ncbi:MAG: histidine kinase, partial [Bacteroidota bacterium]
RRIFALENCRALLGFDDRKLMLFGIPILSVWVFLLLFGEHLEQVASRGYLDNCLVTSLIYTGTFWFFLRAGIVYMRGRFPSNMDIGKRLLIQCLVLLVIYFIVKFGLNSTIDNIGFFHDRDYEPGPLVMNISSLTLGALVISIYEGRYFYNLLHKSILEKEQLQRENIQSQLEGLKNQVNPHFLFNSLNTLTYLIPQDSEKAVRFVQKLSKVYRYILEIRDKELISLQEEMDFIHSYIFLLKERFGDNLNVQLEIEPMHLNSKIVPLSLQILFENAIKHNIISSERPLTITVNVEKGDRLVVRNNLQKKNQVMNSTKVGLQNIKNRYQFFSDEHVRVINTSDEFIVVLPLIRMKDAQLAS